MTQLERHEHDASCCPGRHRLPRGVGCPARQPVWCPPCGDAVMLAIAGLPEQVTQLLAVGGGREASTGRAARPTHGAAVSSSPSPAWETVDEVMRWVWRLEERLRAHLELAPPLDRHGSWRLTTGVGWLRSHSSALLSWDTRVPVPGSDELDGQAEAEAVGREAFKLSRRLERASGRDRLVHRLVAPCPSCDTFALTRADGEDRVRCAVCHHEWPEEHYQLLVRILAKEEQ